MYRTELLLCCAALRTVGLFLPAFDTVQRRRNYLCLRKLRAVFMCCACFIALSLQLGACYYIRSDTM
jgi:hypothetical protein